MATLKELAALQTKCVTEFRRVMASEPGSLREYKADRESLAVAAEGTDFGALDAEMEELRRENDETPITDDWLQSIHFHVTDQGDARALVLKHGMFILYGDFSWTMEIWSDDKRRAHRHTACADKGISRTRGGLRRLCAALGIELKEEPTP